MPQQGEATEVDLGLIHAHYARLLSTVIEESTVAKTQLAASQRDNRTLAEALERSQTALARFESNAGQQAEGAPEGGEPEKPAAKTERGRGGRGGNAS